MRIVVTCGPSYEPIDEVRRLTNFSTGELGVLLANRLAQKGHDVLCFRGVGATTPARIERAKLVPFATNHHLRDELRAVDQRDGIGAVFHAAALADYRVKSVRTSDGAEVAAAKIPSGGGDLTLTLEPVPKLIEELRALFPKSRIVGWKYELTGTHEETLRTAETQILRCGTDACVINGAAYGGGFGFFERNKPVAHCADKAALCDFIAEWVKPRARGAAKG